MKRAVPVVLGLLILFAALIAENDSGKWIPVRENPARENLHTVFGNHVHDIWVAGELGALYHWDGSKWKRYNLTGVTPEEAVRITLEDGVMLNNGSGWLVGNLDDHSGRIFRWNGRNWGLHSKVEGKGETGLNHVAFSGPDHGVAVSRKGCRMSLWNGVNWRSGLEKAIFKLLQSTHSYQYRDFSICTGFSVVPKTGTYLMACFLEWDSRHDSHKPGSETITTLSGLKGRMIAFNWDERKLVILPMDFGSDKGDSDFSENGEDLVFVHPVTNCIFYLRGHFDQYFAHRSFANKNKGAFGIPGINALLPGWYEKAGDREGDFHHDFTLAKNEKFLAFHMLEEWNGWFVTNQGRVVNFKRRGTKEEESAEKLSQHPLTDIWMDSEGHGFIVGDHGVIFKMSFTEQADLRLSSAKREWAAGETVRVNLRKSGPGDMDLSGMKRRVCRDDTGAVVAEWETPNWLDVQRKLNDGDKMGFEWNQRSAIGKSVESGKYRYEIDLPGGRLAAKLLRAHFTILPERGKSSAAAPPAPEGRLALRMGEKSVPQGRKPRFILRNGGSEPVSLAGCRYVIMRKSGPGPDDWREFFTSPADFLSLRTLAPGERVTWKWDRWDNEHDANQARGHRARRGRFQVRLELPGFAGSPLTCRFRLLP